MKNFPAWILCALSLLLADPGFPAPAAQGAFAAAQRRYLRGTLLEHRGDMAGALQAYEEALAADPDSAYIAREAANLALEMGDMDKALKLARRILEIDSRNPKTHILMGRVLWARDDAAGAQAAFEEALKLDPHCAQAILSLGNLLAERAPDEARQLLTRFIRENPEEAAEAHYQIAKLDYDAGRTDSAVSHLQAGIAVEPDSLPLRYALAQAYETRAATAAALAEYLEILKLDPANVALIDHVGEIYFAQGDAEQARARFEAAQRVAPEDPFSSQWLAAESERQGDWARAADYLKASAALADDPGLNLRLSYYHTQAGRTQEAVRVLEGAHARWPANDQISYFLALGYDDFKQGDKSVKLLRQILEVKPDLRDARFQLGASLEKLNRVAEAEKEFRRLLADNPDDASARNYLGYSLAERGLKLAEAEVLIREAVRLEPASPAYLDSLGWVLHKQGCSTEAVTELERAAARGSDDETIWDHLGDAYAAAGSTAPAWLAWKRAESLAEGPMAATRKAAKAQRAFHGEELAGRYLEHLAAVHGRVRKLSSLCNVEGEALGRRFSYQGMLTFKGPRELSLDILGPLFVPLFRVRFDSGGFFMDAISIEGVDPSSVRQALEGIFAALRDYLSGDLFGLQPVRCRKGWRKRYLEAGNWRIHLDRRGSHLAGLEPRQGLGRIMLGDFGRIAGRLLPRSWALCGRGYSLTIKLDQVKVDFMGEVRD